ncbi:hypothetical protein [Microbacterium sp. zg.Y1084]|uniref:hypothetical protein n=1 Tax=Microbacterium sp. zg.Y1084 TaxID=2969667 RepID=UPI00214CB5F4|nr:hypothetical protein [Microbacterium sp. zg.Y1084]MCR2813036.1 hypothetical protein [Microbacterium sp. zg.Y1084]
MSNEIDFNAPYAATLESAFWCATDAIAEETPRVCFGELILHVRNAARWTEVAANDAFLSEWARRTQFSLQGIDLAEAYDLLLEVLLGCAETELVPYAPILGRPITDEPLRELPDLAIRLSRTYVKALLVEKFDTALTEQDVLDAIERRSLQR